MAHNPQGGGATDSINERTIENTRRLVLDFIMPHAFEFYRASESEGDRLRRLASWILTAGKTRVLASDLTANVWDFRGLTVMEINEGVSPLVAGGWLIPTDKLRLAARGRSRRRSTFNLPSAPSSKRSARYCWPR